MRRPEGVRPASRPSLSDWIVDRGTELLVIGCIAFVVLVTPVLVIVQVSR